jgi:membrane protein DedA with SNARE-associated domain
MPSFDSLLAEYGLLAVLVGTFFEGETIVIVASFLSHEGYFDPILLWLCAFLGSFAGDQMWFYIGRRHADFRIVQKVVELPTFVKVIRLIEAHPTKFILSFRFVYGIRNISPVALGLSRVTALKYFILNMIAAAVWAATFTAVGYLFGQTAEMLMGRLHDIQSRLFGAIAAGIVAYLLWRFVVRRWIKVARPPAPPPPPAAEG